MLSVSTGFVGDIRRQHAIGKGAVRSAYKWFIGIFNELQGNESVRADALPTIGLVERCAVNYEKILAAIFLDAVRVRAELNRKVGVPQLPFSVVSDIFCR